MTEEAEHLENIVARMNLEFKSAIGFDLGMQMVTSGDYQTVIFLGETIWDSEQDERRDWAEEPIEPFIRTAANKVLDKLQGFRFKME